MIISGDSLFGGTTIVGVGYTAYKVCDATIINGKVDKNRAKTYGTSTLATGFTTTVSSAYSAGLQSAHRNASTYIESLDDQQLACLVEMLDKKEQTMSDVENLEVSKQMIKKL